ncbi:NEL-type E3 ubiquitin ligase domain-containing protein [Pseudomonas fluorescens]|uniref:NEL-type E3 ubiquitin ligase domain-containing protein n=1 Tax=Pseudomonas fluorescens TaxID=294 RepID=UPI001242343A|nr:NEL-type E3 ubiquitin ligase domain-containing protein [Pseudomonas fluorescens]VVM43659.1 hypothetical protein PS639_00410 [Pseudomonas fluorescens]
MSDPLMEKITIDEPGDHEQGRHFDFIKSTIPECLIQASPLRRKVLKATKPTLPHWYENSSTDQRSVLKAFIEADCHAQNKWDKTIAALESVTTYAKPLLIKALAETGIELDVEKTWVRLYYPIDYKFFGIPTGVSTGDVRSRTFSLLQAALHNFENVEAGEGYFDSDSSFITEPDVQGQFEVLNLALKIPQFVTICRNLDIGSQYEKYINDFLNEGDAAHQQALSQTFIDSKKTAMKAAAYAALLKSDIELTHYEMLVELINEQNTVKDKSSRRTISYSPLRLMGYEIAECAVFFPTHANRYDGSYVIAYIPDDPEHAIKKYASFADFEEQLTHQLMYRPPGSRIDSAKDALTDYQRFFSRFISEKDRGRFFLRFTQKVLDAPSGIYWKDQVRGYLKYLSPVSRLVGPIEDRHWRRDPRENIDLHAELSLNFQWVGMAGIWTEMFGQRCRQMREDAQVLAVSTAAEDAITRERRLSNFLNIGMSVVGIAAFFVPPVGAAMLLVTADQLLFETIEGVRELSQGDKEAGWAHITDVLDNLATMAALAPVFHYTVSPFIEGLKAVTLPSGKTRLWKPDLKPYERNVKLPANAKPDNLGLHRYAGEDILPLEGKHYVLKKDPDSAKYRIQHPTREDAYQPELNHNGSGAWNHEMDTPLAWSKHTVLRRLGPSMDAFTESEREHMLRVSGIHEDALRRMHVENEPTPPLLADTITRFQAYADAGEVGAQIRRGQLQNDLCGYAASLMVELPGWPRTKAIEAFEGPGFSGNSVQYGDIAAPASDVIRVSRAELMAGQLPERVLSSLSEQQIKSLVGQPVAPHQRAQTLQARLADHADRARVRIFQSLSKEREGLGNSRTQLVQRSFSSVSTRLATELLDDATPDELRQMKTTRRLPLRLAQKARLAQQEVRLSRAYEGLFLGALAGPDTESLVLHTLAKRLGTPGNLRIEVRDGSFTAAIRASVGPEDALERKVLVRSGDGQYEARDASDNHLHGRADLYAALQHALPDAQRRSLGLPHVSQGADLEALIQQHALARDELRSLLNMQAQRQPFFKPLTLLPDGRRGYPLSGSRQSAWEQLIEARIKKLYPEFTREEIDEFVAALDAQDGSPERNMARLEREYEELNNCLQEWLRAPNVYSGARGSPQYNREWGARIKIAKALMQAWQRTGPKDYDAYGNYCGQRIYLSDTSLQYQLRSLPALEANFDHVTRLELIRSQFSNRVEGFLGHFRQLRALDLSSNQLTRLPAAISDMPHLIELHLSNNQIRLTGPAVENIKNLTRLKILGMENNPLGLPPDISRMPDLHIVNLSKTGLATWPTGTFSLPRPRHFDLRLVDNPITRMPVVAPGSVRAEIVARTLINRDPQWLSSENLTTLRTYIESVGLDPDRRSPNSVISDSSFWIEALPAEQRATPQLRALKRDLWGAVADEFGSEAFFAEIQKLASSADASPVYRAELAGKVWRMLEAAAESAELREKLFMDAFAPSTCVDSSAQVFNAMGIEVMVHEAYGLVSKGLVESELVSLARGKSRLDELGKIAQARVKELLEQGRKFPEYDLNGDPIIQMDEEGNYVRSIDAVEIHLAYVTKLAERLDLPWQSRSMRVDEPDVTLPMIEAAYKRVLALEEGDLLRDSILEQDFWSRYIQGEGVNRKAFNSFRRRIDAVLDLQVAQTQWTQTTDPSARTGLREKIVTLATLLGKQPDDVAPGRVMTDDEYSSELVLIDTEKNDLLKKLTREAMDSAKLQRVEIPFTVQSDNR